MMETKYNPAEPQEPIVPIAVTHVQASDVKVVLIDEQTSSPTVTAEAISVGSKRDIRGAGIAGGVVGLLLGGPVLAVAVGYLAAWVAKTKENPTGNFARDIGGKTASYLDRLKDWVDGEENQGQLQ